MRTVRDLTADEKTALVAASVEEAKPWRVRLSEQLPGALHRAAIGCIVEDGLCRAPHLLHARMLMVALDSDEPGYAAYVAASHPSPEPLDVDRADRASAALHDWLGPSHLVSTDETHVEVCRDPQHPTHAAMVEIVREALAADPGLGS